MKNSRRRNTIVASLVALCATVGVVGTATYAIFKSNSEVDIDVTSGKVSVIASAKGLTMSHKEYNSSTQAYDTKEGLYAGTATINNTANTVAISKMLPMDSVSFKINVHNDSDVKVKYRIIFGCASDDGLYNGLDIKFDNEATSGFTTYTKYAELEVGSEDKEVSVSVSFPEDADSSYSGKSCKLYYKVEAVQGNAKTEDLKDDTLYIFNATDLVAFSNAINNKTLTTVYTNVSLQSDVDLKNYSWTPINWYTNYGDYDLNFDGNNHTISNLTVEGLKKVGFFGAGSRVYVKNVIFDKANVKGINHVGVIIGGTDDCGVENCTVKNSTVLSYVKDNDDGDKAGAIVGYLCSQPTAYVKGCTVENCSVTGYRDVGGVVGYANYTSNSTLEVSGNTVKNTTITCDNSINYQGYLSTDKNDVHEIVGEQVSGSTVENNTYDSNTKVVIKNS